MKNFIFDLYGTLIDVRTDEWSDAFWQRANPYLLSLSAKPIDFKAAFLDIIIKYEPGGEREADIAGALRELFLLAGKRFNKAEIYAIGKKLRKISTIKLKLYPDTLQALSTLKRQGKKVYLLSNAQALFTAPELDELELTPLFDGIELSSDFGYRKPSPLFFDYIVNKYNLEKSQSVYVGNDYGCDVLGARRAGLKSIYIRTETSPIEDEPKENFVDIRHFLDGDHEKLYKFLIEL